MIKEPYLTIRRPRVTEKATRLREKDSTLYVFEVHPSLNKQEIKTSVEQLFGVKVETVRTQQVQGKIKRMGRSMGRQPGWKKAYVKLREGQKTLEFFEG